MGRAIVEGLVILLALAIIGIILLRVLRHKDGVKGDLNLREERKMQRLVIEAAMIFSDLGPKAGIDDSDFLSHESKQKIEVWMDKYQKNRREFERA